ncbi:MAG: TIGR00730 family Rossman fold protein, partial [Betaproteobacteria bacterium]|nr:TIGR00730 family Rossman fold protein [Betaproteobacteria bacterium]
LEREVVHTGLNELHVVESMHERKALMRAQSDAFIALPGGLGTLDELFEVAALTQLGEHHKPCGLLNTSGFFDGLRGFLDHAVAERFVTPVHRDLLVVESDPRRLIAGLRAWKPAQSSKWMDRKA